MFSTASIMSTLRRFVAPTLLAAAVVFGGTARADNNAMMKAVERWMTEAGLDERYGYRPQDRPEANAAIEKLKKRPIDLRLWEDGGRVGWRSVRKLDEPHQRCGLAAIMDGASLWVTMKNL
jgi:hypothetical protein